MTDDTTGTETAGEACPDCGRVGPHADVRPTTAAPTEARGPVARLRRKVAEVGELLNSPPPGTGAAWRKIAEAAAPETEGREVECPTCGWSTANPEWEQHACPGPRHSYDGTGWCSIHRSPDCVLTDASLPAAQPAAEGAPSEVAQYLIDRTLAETGELAEGAREDDGLGKVPVLLALALAHPEVADWLAEDRRRARAEGGAGALEEAADALLLDCSHFDRYRGKPEWCGYCESAAALLRDRAAGMRETGGKGQSPRDALLNAAARLTDMGISARAAELLTEWAGEA